MPLTLYYAHDPMCSWCWAFRPTWDHISHTLPRDIEVVRLLGGLAPDTDEPMPEALQRMLQDTWRNIQARIPGTEFNFEFWSRCKPRRATYPACRAVIAASQQGQENHESMTKAIQRAYYLQALNPSDDETLIALAEQLHLDVDRFSRALNSVETCNEFDRDIALCRQLNIPGFPTLLLKDGGILRRIPVEFNDRELQMRLITEAAGVAA